MIPENVTQQLQALQSLQAGDPPTVEVFYNAEDPVKARYVQYTIKSRAQDATTRRSSGVSPRPVSSSRVYRKMPRTNGTIETPAHSSSAVIPSKAQRQ